MKTDRDTPTFIIPLESIDPYLKDPETIFIGRHRVGNKIYTALKHACGNSGGGGCFLIGGYRGAGKTVLVKRQIAKLQERKDRGDYEIAEINIDLGVDNDINTREILCDIAESLLLKVKPLLIYQRIVLFLSFMMILAPTICLAIYIAKTTTLPIINSLSHTWNKLLPSYVDWFLPCLISLIITIPLLLPVFMYYRSPAINIALAIKALVNSIRYARVFHKNSGISAKITNISIKEIRKQEPISTRRIQQRIKFIFSELHSKKLWIIKFRHRGKLFDIGKRTIQPIIVFDEIDKINTKHTSDSIATTKARKESVDVLLGGLKSLLNRSKAIFIFIAGREMVDAFHSESGYTSVLYEGVFQDIFYIPTLLSDHSDGRPHKLQSMISTYVDEVLSLDECYSAEHNELHGNNKAYSEKYAGDYIDFRYKKQIQKKLTPTEMDTDRKYCYCPSLASINFSSDISVEQHLALHKTNFYFIRRIFIRYLALHTRGNCKRLSLMIHEFIESYSDDTWKIATRTNYRILGGKIRKHKAYLLFRPEDIKRFFLSAKLYSLFDINTARQLSRTDDKLVVSSLIAMLDITKMHNRGFAREMLDRTVAGIDIHAESNLHNITDELINSTFFSIIRRTLDNIYPYRFYHSSEIEFFYLCKSMGARASSFEYSLDAADPVKNYYLDEVKQQTSESPDNSAVSSAKLKVILGDIHFAERIYDKAFSSYCDAIYLLKRILSDTEEFGELNREGILVYSHYLLIEVLLKKGLMEEVRENNSASLRTFKEAQATIQFAPRETEKQRGFSWKTYTVERKTNGQNTLELDSYEKWLTKSIYKQNDSTNLNMLVHSMLASDFLSLKSGKNPSSPLSKEIPLFNSEETAPTLYTKIMLFHFFSMNLKPILDSAKGVYLNTQTFFSLPNENSDESPRVTNRMEAHPFLASFVYGQAAFCYLADCIKQAQHTLDSETFEASIIAPWLNLIAELHSFEFQDRPLHKNFSEQFENKDIVGIPTPADVINAFEITYFSALGMETKGNYAMAGEMYCAIVLNWVSLLEFIPWQKILKLDIDPAAADTMVNVFKKRPFWLQTVIDRAGNSIRKSEQGTFNGERSSLYSKPDKYTFKHEVNNILQHLSSDGNNQKYELASLVTWFRSNTSSYLLIFGLWEQFCRAAIGFWLQTSSAEETTFEFHIDQLAPPVGSLPRASAIYLWLRGRQQMLKLISRYCEKGSQGKTVYKKSLSIGDSDLTEEIEQLCGELIEIISVFSQAIDEAKLSAKSDDPDTFPPKSIIYLDIFEVLQSLYNPLKTTFKQYIHKRIDDEDKYTGLLKSLFDESQVHSLLDRCHRDMKELTNIYSNSYRRKMRHKFYLYDDFEDPFFIAEWSFLMMISAGSIQIKTE